MAKEFKMLSREELKGLNPFERRKYLTAFWNKDRIKYSDSDQAKKSKQVIKWGRSKEGYVESKCGRFDIEPHYYASTYIQGYGLNDRKTHKSTSADTHNELKAEAQAIIYREEQGLPNSNEVWRP